MADSAEETFAFNLLARYYEGNIEHDELQTYVELLPYSANERPQSVLRVCDGALLNNYFLEEQEYELRHCSTHWELRNRILSNLGFRVTEAEEVMRCINVKDSSSLSIRNAMRGSNAENTLSRLDLIDAIYVAAFLETSVWALLVDRPEMIPKVPDRPWHFFLTEKVEDEAELFLPVRLIPDSQTDWPSSLSELSNVNKLGKGMKVGKLDLEGLGWEVGVTVLYSSSFVQISFTVDSEPHAYWADWEFRLMSFARRCGIGGPCVYSSATPYLSVGPARIHRMSWLLSQTPADKLRLYSRILSPRTVEVTVFTDSETRTIKYPFYERDQVVRALIDLSIVDPTPAREPALSGKILDLLLRSFDTEEISKKDAKKKGKKKAKKKAKKKIKGMAKCTIKWSVKKSTKLPLRKIIWN